MDWKGDQKIRRRVAAFLAFVFFFSVFMFALARYESRLNRERLLLLLGSHPQLETQIVSAWKNTRAYPFSFDELSGGMRDDASHIQINLEKKYGYRLNDLSSQPVLWAFWGCGIFFGALFFGAASFWNLRKEKEDARLSGKERELFECLERFRAGELDFIPDADDGGEWMKICESLRELGAYFSALKERLLREENNTKAFITDISHQLKTPIAALKMSHELAEGSGIFDPVFDFESDFESDLESDLDLNRKEAFSEKERRDFFRQEAQEIEKLELLLDELVNLSRLEAHMIQIKPVIGGLKQMLAAAVSRIYMKAKKKNIELQLEMEEDVSAYFDPKWTQEAIVNVLDNAVKYSGERTTVSMRVTRLVNNALLEIEDEGIGICPQELSKIYERFYRGMEASHRVKEGAGVGLYLARMILERQGGTICAKRKIENGTIFKITLPLRL